MAEKQHGEMLRGIIAEREADRREKIGGFVEIDSAVAERSESLKIKQKERSLQLKKAIEQKIGSRPSLILRHEMGPDGYRYCACAKCKAAHKKAHPTAAEDEEEDKGKDDFDQPIVTKRSIAASGHATTPASAPSRASAATPSAGSLAGVLAKLAIDEDEVYDCSQQITVREPVEGQLGGVEEHKESTEESVGQSAEQGESTPPAAASNSAPTPAGGDSDDAAGSATAGADAGKGTGEAPGDDYEGDDFEPEQPEPDQ